MPYLYYVTRHAGSGMCLFNQEGRRQSMNIEIPLHIDGELFLRPLDPTNLVCN